MRPRRTFERITHRCPHRLQFGYIPALLSDRSPIHYNAYTLPTWENNQEVRLSPMQPPNNSGSLYEYHYGEPDHAERTSLSSKKSKYVKAIAIQKLGATPRSHSAFSSSSSNPVTDLTVRTGVLSWNVKSGVGVGGVWGGFCNVGESVNDKECEGAWFLNVDNTRPKKLGCWLGCGTCVRE